MACDVTLVVGRMRSASQTQVANAAACLPACLLASERERAERERAHQCILVASLALETGRSAIHTYSIQSAATSPPRQGLCHVQDRRFSPRPGHHTADREVRDLLEHTYTSQQPGFHSQKACGGWQSFGFAGRRRPGVRRLAPSSGRQAVITNQPSIIKPRHKPKARARARPRPLYTSIHHDGYGDDDEDGGDEALALGSWRMSLHVVVVHAMYCMAEQTSQNVLWSDALAVSLVSIGLCLRRDVHVRFILL